MADHFEEVTRIRISELETRVDDEAQAVKEHFDEQRKFITETLDNQTARLQLEWRTGIGRLDLRIDRLERKMDGRFDAIHVVLRDILDRLPPAPPAPQ